MISKIQIEFYTRRFSVGQNASGDIASSLVEGDASGDPVCIPVKSELRFDDLVKKDVCVLREDVSIEFSQRNILVMHFRLPAAVNLEGDQS